MKPQLSLLANNGLNKNGFSIMEIMVAMSLFLMVILLTGTVFSLAQRTYVSGSTRNELSQNIRVYFDRISRELRQASALVTDISAATNEIMFQDGHDTDYISYIRYYLLGNDIYRQHIAYYYGTWPVDPDQYRLYSAEESGFPPTAQILDAQPEGQIVGEYFNDIYFVGENGLVTLTAELQKSGIIMNYDTKVFIRNQ